MWPSVPRCDAAFSDGGASSVLQLDPQLFARRPPCKVRSKAYARDITNLAPCLLIYLVSETEKLASQLTVHKEFAVTSVFR